MKKLLIITSIIMLSLTACGNPIQKKTSPLNNTSHKSNTKEIAFEKVDSTITNKKKISKTNTGISFPLYYEKDDNVETKSFEIILTTVENDIELNIKSGEKTKNWYLNTKKLGNVYKIMMVNGKALDESGEILKITSNKETTITADVIISDSEDSYKLTPNTLSINL